VYILFKEQKYKFLREMASGNVSLRCTKKKCSARIEMDKPVNGEHLHDIVNNHDGQCHILRNNCKRKATKNIINRPSKIMRHKLCASENTEMVSDDIGNIRVSMFRQRRKLLPTTPQSLEEAINLVSNRNILTNGNETFCYVDIESKIIFPTTKSNIQYMYHNSSLLVADGIFYVCPKFFYQLFTIHVVAVEDIYI
jgi:hypothetical protein